MNEWVDYNDSYTSKVHKQGVFAVYFIQVQYHRHTLALTAVGMTLCNSVGKPYETYEQPAIYVVSAIKWGRSHPAVLVQISNNWHLHVTNLFHNGTDS